MTKEQAELILKEITSQDTSVLNKWEEEFVKSIATKLKEGREIFSDKKEDCLRKKLDKVEQES